MRTRTPSVLLLLLSVSYSQPAATEKPVAVDGTAIKAQIQKLASDEMEGRAPAGKGADLATEYVSNFFKSIGLKTQFQAVPMVGITSTASPLQLSGKGGKKTLKYGDDFVAWSKQEKDSISANAELVFCGYGVVAPEYQRSEEHTSELQSLTNLVCRLLLEKKKK